MDIKYFLDLYKLDKIGLFNEKKRMCSCNTELSEKDKICPNCGIEIKKSKLLNVGKNSALGKRYESVETGDTYGFNYYQLLSNGFELYETEMLSFSINKKTSEVKISNSKVFKTIGSKAEFINFLDTKLNGFLEYVNNCLSEFDYDYAIRNFTSLSESQLSNFVYIYMNYRAIIPYLRGYKIFYYGTKLDLNKYYPNVDFNDINEVKKIDLNLDLLLSLDLKNEKYIEGIIDISKNKPKEVQEKLIDIMHNMLNDRRGSETYENTINSFSLIYNEEITVEDFIRIYNNSRNNYFNKIFEFKKIYKKQVKKVIDWSTIEKIDRKTLKSLSMKDKIKKDFKMSSQNINKVYDLLEENPIEALRFLNEDL